MTRLAAALLLSACAATTASPDAGPIDSPFTCLDAPAALPAPGGRERLYCTPTAQYAPPSIWHCVRADDAARYACMPGASPAGTWYSYEADSDAAAGIFMSRAVVHYETGALQEHQCGQETSDLLPDEWCL